MKKTLTKKVVLVAAIVMAVFILKPGVAEAACATPSTDFGSATKTVSVPAAGSYRVWSRIKAPDTTNNSYMLEIDGGTCVTVGDSSSIAANNWTWVDYQSGTTSTKTNVTLTAGNHSIKMIGREANVQLDRVILTADTSCVPSGTGDNCASPPDTTKPTVSLTAPSNGATLSGTVNITATAADDVGVDRVQFIIDGAAAGTDTTAGYSYSWDTTSASNGTHSIVARAYDAAGNQTNSSAISVNVSNGKPDLIVTAVNWTPASPSNGNAVTFSATIRNQGTVATPSGVIHGVGFNVDGNQAAWSDNSTAALAPGASRTITANGPGAGTWTAVGGSHTVSATIDDVNRINESTENNNSLSVSMEVNSPDVTPPTAAITSPGNNATVSDTVNITTTATDAGSGISRVEFYIGGQLRATDTSSPYTYAWDTKQFTNGDHVIYVKSVDKAGNSTNSASRTIKVSNVITTPVAKPGDVNGDNKVDIFDASILGGNWGRSGMTRAQGDLNADNVINIFDASILAGNWGK